MSLLSTEANHIVQKMARILAKDVTQISDARACSDALHRAGFTPYEITAHLERARRAARKLRTSEIDRRYARLWK